METSRPELIPPEIASAPSPFSWRKKLLLFLALVAALYAIAAWQGIGLRDPRYHGRRLSAWLNDMGHGSGTFALNRADFRAMGPGALNWLNWAAEHGHVPPVRQPRAPKPSPAAQWMHEWWMKVFYPRVDEGFNERNAALIVLGGLGPDAAPAIPVLARVCHDPSSGGAQWAAKALVAIGPEAWPAVDESFRTSPAGGRMWLVYAVRAHIHESLPPLTDAELARDLDFIVRACRDPDDEVRSWAAATLQKTGGNTIEPRMAGTAVPMLITLLSDPVPGINKNAYSALLLCSQEHAAAVPRVIELLDDPDPTVRWNAAWVLGNIDRVEKRSQSRLQELTNDPEPKVRTMAKSALRYLDAPPVQHLGR